MPVDSFDSGRVAAIELGWWQAHNEKNIPELRRGLEQQTEELYGVDSDRAAKAVQHLVEATQYHDVRNWDAAVDACEQFFVAVHQPGDTFNPRTAATLEIGWWRLHDQLEHETDKTPLIEQFTQLYVHLYGGKPEHYAEVAQLRAEATVEHDLAETEGKTDDQSQEHWRRTGEKLREFYIALAAAVKPRN